MADDDDFEDLLGEIDLLQDSSQESLTFAAANLTCQRDQPGSPRDNAGRGDVQYASRNHPNAVVIDKIEEVFERVTDALLNDRNEISITLKPRRPTKESAIDITDDREGGGRTRQISFPGKTEEEAWKFAVVIRILELMHEALRKDVVMSKRDMFYQDPALFGSQSVVDRCVDDIAHTFNTTRTALNVTAVAKGLIAGAGTFCRRDGSTIRCDADRDGILVPALKELLSVNLSGVKWILVIEKEATFRSIAGSAFWETTAAEGMILTGKGYPDLATRALLRFLSEPSARNGFASPVIFGLADFDPDGLAILSTYKHGSKALAHESSGHSVPQLRWLGLKSSLLPHEDQRSVGTQGVLKLTKRDRSKARGMLEQHVPSDIVLDLSWQSELRHMLMLNVKAELQMLDATPDGMTKLLNSALCCPG